MTLLDWSTISPAPSPPKGVRKALTVNTGMSGQGHDIKGSSRAQPVPALHGADCRPLRLLDLFCCAGGAGMGYSQAGFEVVGVDIKGRRRYPFEFIQADVLSLEPGFLASFDAIHASPPCQFATSLRHAPGGREHPNLIPATRALLKATGLPYVIENVEEARAHLAEPILLCGSMFDGLETAWINGARAKLERHRLFESNMPISAPKPCHHDDASPVVGVYGGHARVRAASFGGRQTKDPWPRGHAVAMREAMGMPWATVDTIGEAVPPAYTEWLGRQLMDYLAARAAA